MPDRDFWISIDRRASRTVVEVDGELDIATASKLARAVESLASEGVDIVLRLERAWLIDTVALRRLVRAQDRVRGLGGRLVLAGLDGALRVEDAPD